MYVILRFLPDSKEIAIEDGVTMSVQLNLPPPFVRWADDRHWATQNFPVRY
ncbi:MAG: hypothetical protein JO312_08765 [Hyphomicrobiales bacterium]|nr:hypothetical protein [Hyphomicrobiales bacterium]